MSKSKIEVHLDASVFRHTIIYNVSDLGFDDKEWAEITKEEKREIIQAAIDDYPEQPNWIVNKWVEK